MKSILLIFLILYSTFSFSQSFSNFESGLDIKNKKIHIATPVKSFTITHSVSQDIMPGISVSCNNDGVHYENSYYRVFDLAGKVFNMNGDWSVQEVQLGVGYAKAGFNAVQNIKLILYVMSEYDGISIPLDSLNQKGDTIDFQIFDNESESIKSVNLATSISIPYGSVLVTEVLVPDGQKDGNIFFIGSNNLNQTDNTYIKAAHCGVNEPVNLADIGYPDMHLVLNVLGAYDAAEPKIVSFKIAGQLVDTEINNNPNNIKVILPADTLLTNLTPEVIVPVGFHVSPTSGEIVDFSLGEVEYVVSNETNKILKTWLVSVSKANPDIIDVQIENQVAGAEIDLSNHIVTVNMPSGTDLSSIIPNIEIYKDFVIDPSSGNVQDFSSGAITYTVSHETLDLSQEWKVNVINLSSFKNSVDIKIYPNPVSDFFHISGVVFNEIEILNVSGEVVISTNKSEISTSKLSDGIYFVKIFTPAGIIIKKVIILR